MLTKEFAENLKEVMQVCAVSTTTSNKTRVIWNMSFIQKTSALLLCAGH